MEFKNVLKLETFDCLKISEAFPNHNNIMKSKLNGVTTLRALESTD